MIYLLLFSADMVWAGSPTARVWHFGPARLGQRQAAWE
jgi:hypothetical protein